MDRGVVVRDYSRPTVKPTAQGGGADAGKRHGERTWLEGTGWMGTGWVWVNDGRTGLLGVAFDAGDCKHACESVAAAVASDKGPPVQHLSWGSGARALVRQTAAEDVATPSIGPIRHAEVVPHARGQQGRAHVPTPADRAECLVVISWNFPRCILAETRAHGFVLGQLRRGHGCRGGGLWDPDHPIKRSGSNHSYGYVTMCRT